MAVLITGGAGYIGSHTCVELLNAGHELIVVDNFSNSKAESLKRVAEISGKAFQTYHVDLLNGNELARVFTENKIDAVIHCAGLKAVGESATIPLSYYRNNVMGTIILCEVMRQYGVKNLVFSSSATVYGRADHVPIREDTLLAAANPYGRTKHMIEEILIDLSRSDSSWSITLLRYFNPIGAHESGRIGEDPNGIPNNLMPYISQVAVGKRKQLHIFGDDYPTKDGTGIRDYIHVVDLAIGHIKALEKVMMHEGVNAFNLGTGKGYSVLDVVYAFEKASQRSIPYTIVDRRHGDSAICFADVTKAKKHLGFEAKRGLSVMCEDAWRWQFHNPNGYEEGIENIDELKKSAAHATGFFIS